MPKRPAKRKVIIIAGPNGAGKTTFALEFLPLEANCPDFVNADLIARGLSPFSPDKAALQAAKIMLTQIGGKVIRGESFALETTLSGLNYSRHIPRWRQMGYYVELIFLSLPSADIAVDRVKVRVSQGGHDIAERVIRRRFNAGLINFKAVYQPLVNEWTLYDNAFSPPRIIAKGDNP